MPRELPLVVEVVALDLACRCCWATASNVPRAMADVWASAHRDAVVVQAHVVAGGRRTVLRPR